MDTKAYLLCGLTGSGKTTLAKRLESRHSAVRFSVDEWMLKLYGEHMPRDVFDVRLAACKALILELSEQLLSAGVSVIWDFGFWRRAEREQMDAWLSVRGFEAERYFLDAPLDELWARLKRRNATLDNSTFEITREMLEMFAQNFEPPLEREGWQIP